MRIDSPISCNAQITGSFTGSFIGDGSGLTGVTAEWDGSHNGDASITGSLNVSSNIVVGGTVDGVDVALLSTNYNLTSASAAANAVSITSLSGSAHTQRTALISALSSSVDAHLDANISALSASVDTHLDANISALSGSAHTQRAALISALSSSVDAHLDANISALSGSAHTQRAALDSAQTTARTNLSSSLSARIASNDSDILALQGTDITLTLAGDLTGNVTFTNLGNGTLTAAVVDDSHNHIISNVDGLQAALDLKAPLASPALTGSPTAPTQAGTDDSTKIATTAFVQGRIDAIIGTAGSTLDTLGELSASLSQDSSSLASLVTTVGGKLAKADNLSDLADAATARTNLGVDTKANTWTGISGDISITSAGVATVADDSHAHIIANVDGLQTALDAKQNASTALTTSTTFGGDVSGTYNAIVVADDSHNHIISNVDGLQTALDGKSSTSHNHTLDSLSNVTITTNASGEILKWNGTAWVNNTLAEAGIQAAGTYNTIIGTDTDISYTGATVLSAMTMTDGVIESHSSRTLTLADLGYTGATNADNYSSWTIKDGDTTTYTITSGDTLTIAAGAGITSNFTADDVLTITNTITNNNQLTNGAGYTTNTGTVTSVATSGGLTGGTITSTGTISISSDARPNANQYFGNSGGDYTYYDNTNGLIRWYVNSSEEMRLDASGNLNVDGDVIAYSSTISDGRLKDDKKVIDGALGKIEALSGYSYVWNAGKRQGKTDLGVIAQEVETVLPEIVHEKEMPFIDGNVYKTVDYEKLTAVLIEAVKELSAKVKELESK